MANTKTRKSKEPTTQLTVLLPTAEKNLLQQAAQASGSRSLSAFIREAASAKAQAILSQEPVNPAKAIAGPQRNKTSTLYAYIGTAPPENAIQPAVAFPSIRNFATVFSDRNRVVLRYLARNAPRSITALSEEFGYYYTGLHRNLSCLAGYGIIAYHGSSSSGQHLTPYLLRKRIRLILPLSAGASENGLFLKIGVQADAEEALPEQTDKVLASISQFAKAMPAHSLILLEAIAHDKPGSAEKLAHITGIPIEGLYQKLKALNRLGLITTLGRHPIKPVLAYDGLTLELVFAS